MFSLKGPSYAPGDVLEVAGHPVRLRVDGRARRVSLRVDAASREVVATAPTPRRLKDAAKFAADRAGWIAKALDKLPDARALVPGAAIELLGKPTQLERAASRRTQGLVEDETGARLLAYGADDFLFARAVVRLLKADALRFFTERTAVHAAALGQAMPKVAVTDTRGRWGSCTPARGGRSGSIRYSWRLVLAPWAVADYVAAHECSHLVQADHSPKFWAVVDTLTDDVKRPRAWLRAHGPSLHAVGK